LLSVAAQKSGQEDVLVVLVVYIASGILWTIGEAKERLMKADAEKMVRKCILDFVQEEGKGEGNIVGIYKSDLHK